MSPLPIFSQRKPPAMLTSTSMPPKRIAIAAIALRVLSTSARSAPGSSRWPEAPNSACISAEGCATSISASLAPVRAKARATADPRAPKAPVTTTTCALRVPSTVSVVQHSGTFTARPPWLVSL